MKEKTILIIGGATASGKTALSIKCAKTFNGEVISADSMQVYKEMNIGTAKITPEEMEGIPHYLIDILEPTERYNAADFQRDAEKHIDDILSRGKLPIICGGTGLFISSILFNYDFDNNKKQKCKYNPVLIVLDSPREQMYDRINKRVDVMINQGLIEEVERLYKKYSSVQSQIPRAVGYKEFFDFINGRKTLEECSELYKQNTRNYAKRQITWFKNQWPSAIWLPAGKDSANLEIIKKLLK
jgi:tRNA dimethylallyltransferase